MKKASYKSAMKSAKKTISRLSKSVDFRGLNTKKNYSSFWMNDEWDNKSKFDGLPSTTGYVSNDLVKLIKLSNYRRAITNFVKIVTNKDIHVTWAGSNSFTDGQAINLTTDIKDNNFDVTVGLALHEASHIILSDFELLKSLMDSNKWHPDVQSIYTEYNKVISFTACRDLIKDILNWIEDRRIDHYIFSTSPGYKAYYHKMYDHYWNDEKVTQGLQSQEFRQPAEIDSWMFQIINMLNPVFDKTAMPRLEEVVQLIDVRNINRLKTTGDALLVALSVVRVILASVQAAVEEQGQGNGPSNNGPNGLGEGGSQGEAGDESGKEQEGGDNGNQGGLSQEELNKLNDLLSKQRRFLNGDVNKKTASQKLTKQLDDIAKQDIETQSVGGEDGIANTTCLVHDYTSNKIVNAQAAAKEVHLLQKQKDGLPYDAEHRDKRTELYDRIKALQESSCLDLIPSDIRHYHDRYEEYITRGFEVGSLLGKKLQLHNESRERVDNRLTTGRMDAKRLAHAGYGIENVFKQVRIDKYKKANLHISLDGSGSMHGTKWESTLEMTAAIVKAAAYTQGITVQVSIRVTSSQPERPTVYNVYDSRKNSLRHFVAVFTMFTPGSMTPEGLCFEAMLKKGMFMEATKDVDSYFLNISDGAPGCNGYGGYSAVKHTAKIINRMKNELDMKVLSFFIENTYSSKNEKQALAQRAEAYMRLVEEFNGSSNGTNFKTMYGRDASVVDPSNAIMIARELNKKFMTLAA